MKKEEMKKNRIYLENRIEKLKEGLTANAISEDTRNEVNATIERLQQIVDDMKAAEAAAEEGTDDKSEQLRSQINELMATVRELENKLDAGEKLENMTKKVVNSKKFVEAFYNCVRSTGETKNFRKNWVEVAKKFISNNIDDDNIDDFLPGFMLNEIRDAFVGKRHRLLELVDWTGLPTFKALWETGNDMANVHKRGTAKTEQNLEFSPIEIRPDLVYKYIKLDKKVEKDAENAGRTNVLIQYVTRELLDRLLASIENFILLGTAPFAGPTEVAVKSTLGSEAYNALGYMQDTDGAIAIMSKTKYLGLKNQIATTYNRPATHDEVLAMLGVEEIVFNESTFTPTTGTWGGIWYMRPADYKMVGERQPDSYTGFDLAYNQDQYLMEIYAGGGCIVPNNFITLYSAE